MKNNFFDQTDYDGNKIVSRGVFAGILANIAGLDVVVVEQDQWSDYVYEGNVQEGSATIFKDVDASHPYYSAIKAVVEIDKDWVPHSEGTSLYIRPFIIATDPFLGVHPAHTYIFAIILSPVGSYYANGMDPVKICIEHEYVRCVKGMFRMFCFA